MGFTAKLSNNHYYIMVRIDQLPPPRGPRDATPEGISDYMEYAARVLAGEEEELAPDYNDDIVRVRRSEK